MEPRTIVWTIFCTAVPLIVLLDLFLLQKQTKVISVKEAAGWTVFWMSLAFLFMGVVYHFLGRTPAMEFLTAYLIEESLSLDNMFVFIMIFSYFAVAKQNQRRILHWGIFMAIVMRLIFIFAGVKLLEKFHWLLYVFGVVLIWTGVKMWTAGEEKVDPEKNLLLLACKKIMPFLSEHPTHDFFVRQGTRWHGTPALATLVVIAASDLVFAIDSIPAVLAISGDFLIVASSNVFAVLGLRALFFLVSGLVGMFRFLKPGIALILCFVGVKMLISGFFHISIGMSLGVVGGVITLAVVLSVLFPERKSN